MFLVFLDHFDALILKIFFKKIIKYYFNIFIIKRPSQPKSLSCQVRSQDIIYIIL